MRINELVGAKSILGSRTTPGSIGHLLVQKGFTPLGRGSFGEVYLPPGKDYVLKLIEADDTAYLGFIRNAKSSNNPHFPKVVGAPVKVAEFVNAVRLEPLQKWTRTGSDEDEALVWFTWAAQNPGWRELLNKPNMERHRRIVGALLEKHPRLEQAMSLLREWKQPGYEWDLHPNNIMMRGSTPVIIDPWMPVSRGTMAVDAIRAKLKEENPETIMGATGPTGQIDRRRAEKILDPSGYFEKNKSQPRKTGDSLDTATGKV